MPERSSYRRHTRLYYYFLFLCIFFLFGGDNEFAAGSKTFGVPVE